MGGGEGSGPLEEGPWLGWRAPGLFPGPWGGEGQPGLRVSHRRDTSRTLVAAGTPSIRPRPSFSWSRFSTRPPRELSLGRPGQWGGPLRVPGAGAFKKGRFVPSIQAFRPWPLMNLRAARARNRASPSAKASRGRDPAAPAAHEVRCSGGEVHPGELRGVGRGSGPGGPGSLRSDCDHIKPESVFTPSWCRGEPLGLESHLG